MMTQATRLKQLSPLLLVVIPLGVMAILTGKVLIPALQDSEAAYYSSDKGYPAQQRAKGEPIAVETATVGDQILSDNLAAPAEAVPMQAIDLRAAVEGQIAAVYVAEGDEVKAGQPLVKLLDAPYQQQVSIARNNLVIAQSALDAVKTSGQFNLQKLRLDAEVAVARWENAESRLVQIETALDTQQQSRLIEAQTRFDSAQDKLNQARYLVERGALSRLELSAAEDAFATRQRELVEARLNLSGQAEHFNNRDILSSRALQLTASQQVLERAIALEEHRIERAQRTVDNRAQLLQQALDTLAQTTIVAPTDGLISQLSATEGEWAAPGNDDPLVSLSHLVVLKAYVDQARMNAVQVGDLTTVYLTAYPGQSFQGRVTQVNPTVETADYLPGKVGVDRQYTYSVWIAVDGVDLAPGLQGYVHFGQRRAALAIPENAVVHLSGGEGMVMALVGGEAVVRPVRLGRVFDNQREVLGGLQPGDQVILNPRGLNPGDRAVEKADG